MTKGRVFESPGRYYHVELVPYADKGPCRTHDIGRAGHTKRIACQKDGVWYTQKLLLDKSDFDVRSGRLVPVSATAKRWWPRMVDVHGQPVHLKGDIWKFPSHSAPALDYEDMIPLVALVAVIGIPVIIMKVMK